MRSSWPLRAALLGTVACLVGCDHATKVVARAALQNAPPVVIVPGLVDLSYAENRDFAFDMLARLSLHPPVWAITLMPLLSTLVVLIVWLRRRTSTWSEQAGFAFISAGAIGNAADRLLRGHVVDFIHVHFWPVFNLADALIVVGAGLLWLGMRPPTLRPRWR